MNIIIHTAPIIHAANIINEISKPENADTAVPLSEYTDKFCGKETVRYSNFKNADMYISDFDKILEKKDLIKNVLGE